MEELRKRLLWSSRDFFPVVIFLTGGEGECNKSHQILKKVIHSVRGNILMVFGGMGKDCNFNTLDMLTQAGNDGRKFIEINTRKISLSQRIRSQSDRDNFFEKIFSKLETLF